MHIVLDKVAEVLVVPIDDIAGITVHNAGLDGGINLAPIDWHRLVSQRLHRLREWENRLRTNLDPIGFLGRRCVAALGGHTPKAFGIRTEVFQANVPKNRIDDLGYPPAWLVSLKCFAPVEDQIGSVDDTHAGIIRRDGPGEHHVDVALDQLIKELLLAA